MSEQLPDNPNPSVAQNDADDHLSHLMMPQTVNTPLYKGLIDGIRDLIHPPKLPPLEVTSKPGEVTDDHLSHLMLPTAVQTPWYKGLYEGIRDLIHPPKLPPLEVTSKPVEVKTMKGLYAGNEWKAGLVSACINVGAILILLFLGTNKAIQEKVKETVTLIAPNLKAYVAPPKAKQMGGGGGGDHSKIPESKGKLPRPAPRQFVPPRVDPIENPVLPMTPTIVASNDIPNIDAPNMGNPLSSLGIPSNGTGLGGSIGAGKGPGVGPGTGGGFGGGAFRIGGGVSAPVPTFKPEPEYSEEARKAKYQGSVMLSLIVDEKGVPQQIKVVRKLGLGLDEKAVEAVAKWRFKPGMKDGKPVPVQATIEVTFRLL